MAWLHGRSAALVRNAVESLALWEWRERLDELIEEHVVDKSQRETYSVALTALIGMCEALEAANAPEGEEVSS